MKPIRLSKALAQAGVASRRKCEEIIFSNRVKVNGTIVSIPQTMVLPGKDKITIDDQGISRVKQNVYYILHKPKGYLSSHRKSTNERTVYDLLPPHTRLFSAGRLDRDTTGLMILTSDGHFANRIAHPSYNCTKEYLVRVKEEIEEEHLLILQGGVYIDGVLVKPRSVKKIRGGCCKICLQEGKKHEVRLLVLKAGLDLKELVRIRIGSLHLGSIPEGSYREMTPAEIALFDEPAPSKSRLLGRKKPQREEAQHSSY